MSLTNSKNNPSIQFYRFGMQNYETTLKKQQELRLLRQSKQLPDSVILVEHPRVITQGRRPCADDFLLAPDKIRALGIDIVAAHRGGKLTYHGPGQLVIYFIFSLEERRLSIPHFVAQIEEIGVQILKRNNLVAIKHLEHPGVWIAQKKIISIGLSVDRGVSMHGMAININPNLKDFELINPCGMKDSEVTSMEKELGEKMDFQKVELLSIEIIRELFMPILG